MLSIIIPWCDREELRIAAPQFRRVATALKAELVVVNYAGDRAAFGRAVLGMDPDVLVEVTGEKFFNKPAANNLGAWHASSEFLFFCDNDILLDEEGLYGLLERVAGAPSMFGTLKGVSETVVNSRQAGHVTRFGYTLNIATANGRELVIRDHEEDANDGTRNAPGLLLVRRSHFTAAGGYNSALDGWGWEDQDMISRLTLGAGLERVQHGKAMHISHDDEARTRRHRVGCASRWESRDRAFRRALENYDAGSFMGTFDEDVGRLFETGRVQATLR